MLTDIVFVDFSFRIIKMSNSSRRNGQIQIVAKYVGKTYFLEKLHFAWEVRRFYGYDAQKHIGFSTSKRVNV